MRKIALGTASVLALLAVCGYWYWTRTPVYSLHQAWNAVQQHDVTTFQKYVDVEGVCGRLIDEAFDATQDLTSQSKSPYESLGTYLAKGLVTLAKPTLVRAMKDEVLRFVEEGEFEEARASPSADLGGTVMGSGEPALANEGLSLRALYEKGGAKGTRFVGIDGVKKEGKIAFVGLKFWDSRFATDYVVQIKMRDMGGYWQVAEVPNVAQLLRKISELEKARTPTIAPPVTTSPQQGVQTTTTPEARTSATTPVPVTPDRAANQLPAAVSGTSPQPALPSSAGAGIPEIPGGLVLQVAATERAWVAIDVDGKTVLQRVLNPSEIETLNAKESFDITTGNAQGIILTLNGETLKPLGRRGEVKWVRLTRADLRKPSP